MFKTLRYVLSHPLNANQKSMAFMRYIRWHLGSRILRMTVVCEWINGVKFYVRERESGVLGNLYTGLYEFPDMAYLLHVMQADDVFYDVGSNVGVYSLLACGVVGCKGYAFEPLPETFQRLVENVRLNHLEERCVCVNRGVGETSGILRFTSTSDTMNHVVAEGEACPQAIEIEIAPLDDMGYPTPALMKIDVEGYETLVLRGAEKVLANPKLNSVIMELNGSGTRYGFDEDDIVKVMKGHGFKTFAYDPFARELKELEGKNRGEGNTIFIRDCEAARRLVKAAKPIRIHGVQF